MEIGRRERVRFSDELWNYLLTLPLEERAKLAAEIQHAFNRRNRRIVILRPTTEVGWTNEMVDGFPFNL